MLKKIYNLTLISIAVIGLNSCENLIDIRETDFIGGDIALRTVKNNESLLMSAYSNLNTEMNIRGNGIFSDELKAGEFYASASTHEWRYNYDDVSMRDNFTAHRDNYRIIDRVNRVLQAIPNAIEENASDKELRNKVIGEALFIRAYAHFELFRYYSGNYDPASLAMPYMEQPSLETFARIPMGDYFQKILRDLNEAKTLLPDNLSDKFRANKLTATALHARIALYMRNWQDAVTYSTEYINALPLSTGAEFEKIWTDEGTSEVSFVIPRNNTVGRIGSFYRPLFVRNAQGVLGIGQISWYASDKIFTAFDEKNDVRFNAYLIDEPLLKNENRQSRLVKKYAGGAYASGTENIANHKVFRTAEMYLIRAEARAELNAISGANSAESDLNALRTARITGYTAETLTSKDQAITAIIQERFKELAFEGHRFWDLKRRGLPVDRLATDAPTTDSRTLPPNNFRFVFPIPQTEMIANPKMEQNPGYGSGT
jgi:hypothetical protein